MQRMSAAEYRRTVIEPVTGDIAFQQKIKQIDAKIVKKSQKKLLFVGKSEHDIQTAILNRLSLVKNGFFWRQNSGLVRQEHNGVERFWRAGIKGISDVIGVYKGILVAIEVKQPGKKATADQVVFLKSIRDAGGIAFVCSNDAVVLDQIEYFYSKLK